MDNSYDQIFIVKNMAYVIMLATAQIGNAPKCLLDSFLAGPEQVMIKCRHCSFKDSLINYLRVLCD